MKYNIYQGPGFKHGEQPAVGVLLANLGTPDAPTSSALRRYLHPFLKDPRVIELPKWMWYPILYLFVLTFRPKRSAALYKSVWTDEGSPLRVICEQQRDALQVELSKRIGSPVHVALGMGYGSPSMKSALAELRDKKCRRIIFLPAYPQYSGTTTASVVEALFAELKTWRWIPELRTVHAYHDHPGYIAALVNSIRERWDAEGEPEKLLFSFHGVPQRYVDNGDPYHCHCHKTGRLVAEQLGLDKERYVVAFQSQFGREEWIKPTTDVTIRAMAQSGVKSLDVICPGFSSDCLETLEEIQVENRDFFMENGGEQFRYIPCLNDRADHIDALSDLLHENLQGWVASPADWKPQQVAEDAEKSKRLADRMGKKTIRADAGYGS